MTASSFFVRKAEPSEEEGVDRWETVGLRRKKWWIVRGENLSARELRGF